MPRPERGLHASPLIEMLVIRRRRMGWTQRYVSEQLGVSQPHFSGVETGRYRVSLPFLEKWANIIGVVLTWKGVANLMVCPACKEQRHDFCPGESWCDCQHRITEEPMETQTPMMSGAPADDEFGPDDWDYEDKSQERNAAFIGHPDAGQSTLLAAATDNDETPTAAFAFEWPKTA
jgi:transcriptional regulator with XRE-family HTH domain